MKGIVLAGGKGTRLYPLTFSTSKQLLAVYDKPMIYYPLSTLMLANIREILIISTPQDIEQYKKLLGSGSQFGVKFCYKEQPFADGIAQALILGEEFLDGDSCALILGDNIFYGNNMTQILSSAAKKAETGAVIFGYYVSNPQDFGVVEFDGNGNAKSITEKPQYTKSNYAVTGLYFYDKYAPFYAKQLTKSKRGELEITDLNNTYLQRGELSVQIMGRGMAWLDTGTVDNLLSAANFVSILEKRQGIKIGVPEEIAYIKKFINIRELEQAAQLYSQSPYGKYLQNIVDAAVRI